MVKVQLVAAVLSPQERKMIQEMTFRSECEKGTLQKLRDRLGHVMINGRINCVLELHW